MNKKIAGFLIFMGIGLGITAVLLFQANYQTSPVAASERGQQGEPEMVIAVEEVINGERIAGEVRVTFADPAILPTHPADATGIYIGQQHDAIMIGTGSIEVEVGVEVINDADPVTTVHTSFDGPEETIHVNDQTQFYQDTTAHPKITPEDIAAGKLVMERTIEVGSAASLANNMMIRAWGHQEARQFVADMVVYEAIR